MLALAESTGDTTLEVINTIENALPPDLLPDIFNTSDAEELEEVLPDIYEALAEEFGERPSESGYSQFVEALTVITEAYTEACSSADLQPEDIPGLVQQYVALKNNGSTDLTIGELRKIFAKMLCSQEQEPETTCTSCGCPVGGLEGDIICACEFFRCLDPNDDLKPLFGFSSEAGQALGLLVDTSGSMGGEIEAAKEVMTNLIAREEDVTIRAYILTPFNDYGIGSTNSKSHYLHVHQRSLTQSFCSFFVMQMLDLLL